jgi:arylsulfatase A-like enzyme
LIAAATSEKVEKALRGSWIEPAYKRFSARVIDSGFEPSECADALVSLGRPTNVVLIAVDTLRARHLGYRGYDRATSPNLDALAKEALAFTNARSSAPWTLPSFSGVFTGVHPGALGIKRQRRPMPPEQSTLGMLLCDAGYQTAGVVSHTLVGLDYGFSRGFEQWDQTNAVGHIYVSSERVADRALEYLSDFASDPRPFFLFAHFFDPHNDYIPHEDFPFGPEYRGQVRSTRNNMSDLRAMAKAGELSEEDLAYLRDSYDSEIAYTDSQIGRLLDGLRERGLYESSLILFVADHGEAFGERPGNWIGHTSHLYDEAIHVPLLVKPPGVAARVIDQPVSTVDVLATVFDVLGHPSPPVEAGVERSLLRLDEHAARPVFSQTRRKAMRDSVIDGRWKLIRNAETGEIELFDLLEDPGELRNLADEDQVRTVSLQAKLDEWLAALGRYEGSVSMADVPEISEAERARLQALGYEAH